MVVSRRSRGEKTAAAPGIVPLVGLSRLFLRFVISEVRETEGRTDSPAPHDRSGRRVERRVEPVRLLRVSSVQSSTSLYGSGIFGDDCDRPRTENSIET
jgi:hypothetical protein